MAHGVPVCVETRVEEDFRLTVAALEANGVVKLDRDHVIWD